MTFKKRILTLGLAMLVSVGYFSTNAEAKVNYFPESSINLPQIELEQKLEPENPEEQHCIAITEGEFDKFNGIWTVTDKSCDDTCENCNNDYSFGLFFLLGKDNPLAYWYDFNENNKMENNELMVDPYEDGFNGNEVPYEVVLLERNYRQTPEKEILDLRCEVAHPGTFDNQMGIWVRDDASCDDSCNECNGKFVQGMFYTVESRLPLAYWQDDNNDKKIDVDEILVDPEKDGLNGNEVTYEDILRLRKRGLNPE
jgi:hypothetical protein